jgi:tRNA 2-selenouridine synthase
LPEIIEIEEFLVLNQSIPVVDVRSPAEFGLGKVPGAHNIPVFSNEERAEIGTLYKQKGPEAAMQRGLHIVEPHLLSMAENALKIAKEGKLLVHCWRGGLRSQSMADLFETAGIETKVLKGGYKAFRHYVRESFPRKLDLKIVGGETGSGKTEIIAELKKLGEQVIDLEGLANHRGSSYGAIGMEQQPAIEQFENLLFDELRKIDPLKRLWLEDESRHIGRVFIPEGLWEQMTTAPVYRVHIPFDVRVQRLIKDYADSPKELLLAATERIKKRLGGLDYKNAVEAFENGDIATATAIALKYYDKAYNHPHEVRRFADVHICECADGDPEKNAKNILMAVNNRHEDRKN